MSTSDIDEAARLVSEATQRLLSGLALDAALASIPAERLWAAAADFIAARLDGCDDLGAYKRARAALETT